MMRTPLHLDLASAKPAYQQIVDGLRALLVQQEFAAGDHLPPVRQLAIDLGLHHNTVAEAYRQLAAEGWLELRRGRGAEVLARSTALRDPAAAGRLTLEVEQSIARAIAGGLSRAGVVRVLQALAGRYQLPVPHPSERGTSHEPA